MVGINGHSPVWSTSIVPNNWCYELASLASFRRRKTVRHPRLNMEVGRGGSCVTLSALGMLSSSELDRQTIGRIGRIRVSTRG